MQRGLILFLLFSGLLVELKAQGTVTFRENFFNNNRFKIDGQEAKAPEVAKAMANFEASQKNFLEGHKQMRIGSVLRIASVAGLATGLIYGLSNSSNPNALRTYFLISLPSMGLGLIGSSIRIKGKERVEQSISEYNYLKDQEMIFDKEISIQLRPTELSLVYSF